MAATYHVPTVVMVPNSYYITLCSCSVLHMPTKCNDSDSSICPIVIHADAVSVHLHSLCSGDCSDVQETAEVQS